MHDNNRTPEHREQSHYQTGFTPPQKSHRGILALLLICVIFLGGLFSSLCQFNILLFRGLTPDHLSAPASVRFAQGKTKSSTQDPGLPALGLTGQAVSVFEQQYFRIPGGVYVQQTVPNSSAEKAGIVPGDILIAFNGTQITDLEALKELLSSHPTKEAVSVEFYRNGKTRMVMLTLDEE